MQIRSIYANIKNPSKRIRIVSCIAGKVKADVLNEGGVAIDELETSERSIGRSWVCVEEEFADMGEPQTVGAIEPVDTSRVEYSGDPNDTIPPVEPMDCSEHGEHCVETHDKIDGQHGDADPGDEHVETGFTHPPQGSNPEVVTRPLQPRPVKELRVQAKGQEIRIKCGCGQAVLLEGETDGTVFLHKYFEMKAAHMLSCLLEKDAQHPIPGVEACQ